MSLLLLTVGAALAGPAIPADVQRCMDRGHMWLADPQYFETLRLRHPDGTDRRAYQILDRHRGWTGHLLLFPADCRLNVLAVSPLEGKISRRAHLYAPPSGPTSDDERGVLLKWAGGQAGAAESPEHAAADADSRVQNWEHEAWLGYGDLDIERVRRPVELHWHSGVPAPQQASWFRQTRTTWSIDSWDLFTFAQPWQMDERLNRTAFDAVVYPATDGSNLIGLTLYDGARDEFAWVADIVVDTVDLNAVRRHDEHLWMVSPSAGGIGWALVALDLTDGDLVALELYGNAPGYESAALGPDGLLIAGARELWTFEDLEALLDL